MALYRLGLGAGDAATPELLIEDVAASLGTPAFTP